LVIGDVAGRGVNAASLMGQLRAAVRAYARLDLPPAEVLELLDAIVCELGREQLVTCIYAVYDPAAHELLYANAGHLPPLLAVPGRPTVRLPGATGPPLGVESATFDEERVALRGGAVTALPDALVRELAPGGSDDDIAILVARVSPEPAQETAELDLPPTATALQDGRRFAADALARRSLPDTVVQDATLIVSELLTNAIVHGAPPIRLRLRRTSSELAIEVDDDSSAMPRRLRVGPDDVHGRGLAIVAAIATRWAAPSERPRQDRVELTADLGGLNRSTSVHRSSIRRRRSRGGKRWLQTGELVPLRFLVAWPRSRRPASSAWAFASQPRSPVPRRTTCRRRALTRRGPAPPRRRAGSTMPSRWPPRATT
jgi:anti-sigma regulatory factor (Ser/Thr protein kinase)